MPTDKTTELTVEHLAELREMFPKSRCQVTVTAIEKGGFGVMDFDYAPKLYPHATKQEAEIWLMDVKPSNSELGIKMRAATLDEAMQKVREWKAQR